MLSVCQQCDSCGLTPASPMQLLNLSPTNEITVRTGGGKAYELLGWEKGILIGKAKAVCGSKGKKEKTINSLLLMVRQVFSQIQESRAPLLLEKTNAITLNVPPFHVLPPILYTDVDVITSGISLLAVCVPAVSPPSFPCSPRFLGSVAVQKEEKPLVLHESCPGIIKTSLYCHLCVQHKSKT